MVATQAALAEASLLQESNCTPQSNLLVAIVLDFLDFWICFAAKSGVALSAYRQ